MYLTECYIENFGVLHTYKYDPKQGLNEIYAENGAGKSTFAAFLRAMFYGMPATRNRKNLEDAERKKYKPWQSGNWGGYVCFCCDQGNFRLERFFGERDREDTFRLIDQSTGLESYQFSSNIGQELFGIDRAAFLSTTFISQTQMQVEVNDSISAGIGASTAFEQDAQGYTRAVKMIDDEYKQYYKMGNRGLIPQLEQELSDLQSKRWEKEQLYQQLQSQAEEIGNQEIQDKKIQIQEIDTTTAGGMVTQLSLDEESLQLTPQQRQRLEWLDDYFSSGIPEEEDILEKMAQIGQKRLHIQMQADAAVKRRKILLMGSMAFLLVAVVIAVVTLTGPFLNQHRLTGGVLCGALVLLSFVCFGMRGKQKDNTAMQRHLDKLNRQTQELTELRQNVTEYQDLSRQEQQFEKLAKQLAQNNRNLRQQELLKKQEMLSEEMVGLTTQINEVTTQLEHYRKRAQILSRTKEYLEEAHNRYAAGYLGSVAGQFSNYLAMFDETLAKKAQMSIAFDIHVMENGAQRELDYFSSGMKDIAWFCERMALARALFSGERPFMILDDPFVNLDDAMVNKAHKVLKAVAKDTQIIYLTCQKNRLISAQ